MLSFTFKRKTTVVMKVVKCTITMTPMAMSVWTVNWRMTRIVCRGDGREDGVS